MQVDLVRPQHTNEHDPNSANRLQTENKPARAHGLSKAARWFHAIAGLLMLACVVVGFQKFYFHGRAHPDREITPPIRTLVITHGVAMGIWIMLAFLQPALIAARRHRVHMRLGWVAAATAGAIVVLGLMLGVQSARVSPPDMMILGFNPTQFMAVPVLSVLMFGALVAVGIWQRKRPAVHRAMMLTATLVTLSAALSRIDALNNVQAGTIFDRLFGPFFFAVVLGGALLILRTVMTRSVDRWQAIGLLVLAGYSLANVTIARSQPWHSLASMLIAR